MILKYVSFDFNYALVQIMSLFDGVFALIGGCVGQMRTQSFQSFFQVWTLIIDYHLVIIL